METKLCVCGKNMILVGRGGQLLSRPPVQNQVWICYGCGNEEAGPPYRGKTKEAIEREMWEEAQSKTVWVVEHRITGKPYYWTGELAVDYQVDAVQRDVGTVKYHPCITDDIHNARPFPSAKVAEEVLRSLGRLVFPFVIEEHMIG